MAQVVVLGVGRFGGALARFLYQKGHQVLVLDISEEVIDAIKNDVHEALCLDVRDKQELALLGLQDYDVGVVAIGRMDVSILACLYLKELKVPRVIAKAVNHDHAKILDYIGVDEVVIPEEEMAQRLALKIGADQVIMDAFPFGEKVAVVEMACPSKFVGKTLQELELRKKYHIQVIAIKDVIRETWNIIPSGEDRLKESDMLFILGNVKHLEKLRNLT